jgi:SIR2-like domain
VVARASRALAASELFVFVGAGASHSPPAGLPLFNWLRDEILHQLRLDAFVECSPAADKTKVEVARGLAPEPFMLDLTLAGIDVESWLCAVLGRGRPNAAHHAVAKLAALGTKVWTVNFDPLIEQADPSIEVAAWPEDPYPSAGLVKAHGTLGGHLIVAADQVLSDLPTLWRERLGRDVSGKTVVFLGYSGRDLDFQPIWNEVLTGAKEVLWFEQRDPEDPSRAAGEARKRLLLRTVDARGALSFPPPAPPPSGVSTAAPPNASWDFVAWCRDHGLVDVEPSLARRLFDDLPPLVYPPLPGAPEWARPSVLGHLGDYRAARHAYAGLILHSHERLEAARALVRAEITHGGRPVAVALRVAEAIPSPGGQRRPWREIAHRKRLTIYHRAGHHQAVLRHTRAIDEDTLSTILIIRAAALRITGSLDEAAELSDEALRRARAEQHVVRTAHAAFQKNIALLWAERIDEAERCLNDELEPYAAIAASRWVAWADFIAGGLAVRGEKGREALARYALSEARFGAEALVDGVVSVSYARLAAHRLTGADDDFALELAKLSRLMRRRRRRQRYYGRGNRFTTEAITIERAEFARVHRANLDEARALYGRVLSSRFPLHAALGHLGLALIETQSGQRSTHADRAKDVADAIGFLLVSRRASELRRGAVADAVREVFFC